MKMDITRGVIGGAQKAVIYGPEGVGKSTFASKFPDPLFIDTEGSTKELDVARLPRPTSWTMLLEAVRFVKQNPTICKTLIIDTADWAEQLCISGICADKQLKGIEDMGYGKGYVYLAEEFGMLLNLMSDLNEMGIHTVFTAHAAMRKFEQPDELGAYDRWELKLQKKTAPLLKEWADMILFANYKTNVINVDGQGAQKGKNKARGRKRVMYTTHHPCWDAKNRHGLPDELPFDYAQIASCIENQASKIEADKLPVRDTKISAQEEKTPIEVSAAETQKKAGADEPASGKPNHYKAPWLDPLFDLMIANQTTPADIQKVVAKKGYFPADMPLEDYPEEFVKGCLIAAWEKVHQEIISMAAEETL